MSINKTTLHKLAKQYAPEDAKMTVKLGDKDVEIKLHRVLSMTELGAAAKDIADMQFITHEDGKEEYAPYLREFAERYVTISYFTDIDLRMLKKDDDDTIGTVEPIWQFLMSDIYDQIFHAVTLPGTTYWILIQAACEMVDMKRKQIEPSAAKLWDSLDELVDGMKQSFGEMTEEDLEETRAAIKKLTKLDEGKIVELMR